MVGCGSAPAEQEQADASLPAGWKARRLAPSQRGIEGETYYINAVTGETTYDRPSHELAAGGGPAASSHILERR